MSRERVEPLLLAGLLSFAALSGAAHDVWAATSVYIALLALTGWVLVSRAGLAFPLAGAWGIALLGVGASLRSAVVPGDSLLALFDWLAAALAFVLAANLLDSEPRARRFLAGMVPVIVVELGTNLGQRDAAHLFTMQPPGTLLNSNIAAGFLLPWLPALWSLPGRLWRAAAVVATLSLLSFGSHWSLICLLAALPFFPGPKAAKELFARRPRWLLPLIAAIVVLLAALLYYKFTHRIDAEGNPIPVGRSVSRLQWWRSGLNMFRENPLSGVGLGGYAGAYLSYKVGTGQHSLSAHSFPVRLLAETGLPGFLGGLFLLAAWWRRASRWPFFLGAVLLLAYSLISLGLDYLSNLLAFSVLAGAAVAPAPPWKPRRSVLALGIALLLFAAPYMATPFVASRLTVEGERRLAAGEADRALAAFVSAEETFRLSSPAHLGASRALAARGQWDLALTHLDRAIALDKRNHALWRERAALQLKRGDKAEAAASLARADALYVPGAAKD